MKKKVMNKKQKRPNELLDAVKVKKNKRTAGLFDSVFKEEEENKYITVLQDANKLFNELCEHDDFKENSHYASFISGYFAGWAGI